MTYYSSYHSYQIQYHRNYTLDMGEVACLVYQVAIIVDLLEGSVLLVGIAGVTKEMWET